MHKFYWSNSRGEDGARDGDYRPRDGDGVSEAEYRSRGFQSSREPVPNIQHQQGFALNPVYNIENYGNVLVQRNLYIDTVHTPEAAVQYNSTVIQNTGPVSVNVKNEKNRTAEKPANKSTPSGSHKVLLKLRGLSTSSSQRPKSASDLSDLIPSSKQYEDQCLRIPVQNNNRVRQTKSMYFAENRNKTWNLNTLSQYEDVPRVPSHSRPSVMNVEYVHNYENVYGKEDNVNKYNDECSKDIYNQMNSSQLQRINKYSQPPHNYSSQYIQNMTGEAGVGCGEYAGDEQEHHQVVQISRTSRTRLSSKYNANKSFLYRSKSCDRPRVKDSMRETFRVSTDRLQNNITRFSNNISDKLSSFQGSSRMSTASSGSTGHQSSSSDEGKPPSPPYWDTETLEPGSGTLIHHQTDYRAWKDRFPDSRSEADSRSWKGLFTDNRSEGLDSRSWKDQFPDSRSEDLDTRSWKGQDPDSRSCKGQEPDSRSLLQSVAYKAIPCVELQSQCKGGRVSPTDSIGYTPALENKEVNRPAMSLAHRMRGKLHTVNKKISMIRSRSAERFNSRSTQRSCTEPIPVSTRRRTTSTDCDPVYEGPFIGHARALVDSTPSPYDLNALRFKKDDIIDIISMNASGLWRGRCGTKVGNFKFINVEILPNREGRKSRSNSESRERRRKPRSVQDLLHSLNMQEHIPVFVLNGYENMSLFQDLDDGELDYLGITDPDQRTALLFAVESMFDETNPTEVDKSPSSSVLRDSGCYEDTDLPTLPAEAPDRSLDNTTVTDRSLDYSRLSDRSLDCSEVSDRSLSPNLTASYTETGARDSINTQRRGRSGTRTVRDQNVRAGSRGLIQELEHSY